MSREHRKIWICGRVQGVGFRYAAAEQARRLGLSGFVVNLDDGGVMAEVEGPLVELDRFVSWCHVGPDSARVESVRVEGGRIRDYDSFSIRR